MTSQRVQPIKLENLIVDLSNPRHVPQPSQREAIATIAFDQGAKLANLAEDIVDKGLSPNDLPLVMQADEDSMYIVLEGNRRIAALKLITSAKLLASIGLPKNLNDRFKELAQRAGSSLPSEVLCAVVPREDANYWIQLKHTGENNGVGIVNWDGRARQRFRGSSPALQAIELVENSDYLTEETRKNLEKIAITNVERILVTTDARKLLGVDVKNNHLVLTAPDDEAIGRLAIVITDIANKVKKVTDLDSRDQRIAYAQEVAARPLPTPISAGGTGTGSGSTKPGGGRRIRPDRKHLIPKTCRLTIHQPRINKIYHELQKLVVEDYVNACAVMFRVFIELSLDHYAQINKISLKVTLPPKPGATAPQQRDMFLREKIKEIYEYMEKGGIADKNELRGIKSLYAQRDHVLSVDGLNAYVHNKDYNPTPTDLKANWDSIQMFVEKLWTA